MYYRVVALLITLFFSYDSYAQNARAMRRSDSRSVRKKDSRSDTDRPEGQKRSTLSLNIGTLGIGIEGKSQLSDAWNLRYGGSLFSYKYSQEFAVDNGRSHAGGTANVNFNKLQVLLEGKLSPKFRFVGGAAFFYRSDIYVYGKMLDGIDYNGKRLTPEEAGSVTVGASWNTLSPYFGIGLFRDMPVGKFNVNLDLGTYYIGKPTSKWIGTSDAVQEKITEFQGTTDDILSVFQLYPVLQLNINYSVN